MKHTLLPWSEMSKKIITHYENSFRNNLLEHNELSIQCPITVNTGILEIDSAVFEIGSTHGGKCKVDYSTFRSWSGERFINGFKYDGCVFYLLTTKISKKG